MIKIIIGLKGSGKTKTLVNMVQDALKSGNGDVVVIEKERNLTYDIPYQARLIDAGAYGLGGYEFLKGFISGLHSGNYDITNVFVDNLLKLVNEKEPRALAEFVDWLDKFSQRENVNFVLSISADRGSAPESIKKYFIN